MMELRIEKSHFTDLGDEYVDKVANIFRHMSFAPDAGDWKWLKISGDAFGQEWEDMNFFVHPNKDGFSVQMIKKESTMCYMFGINFNTVGNVTYARAYHHGHGPFPKLYGFDYEIEST